MRPYKYYLVLFFLLGLVHPLAAQNKAIDVQHYRFEISLNDTNDTIHGKATIDFIAKKTDRKVYFDLNGFNDSTGKGMLVSKVQAGNSPLEFIQDSQRIYIDYAEPLAYQRAYQFTISYSGIPADGLIISKNEFGYRTFFADNWPMRAHYWIPCNDHPLDKASVEFLVTAPDHYQVVGNGILVEETSLPQGMRLTHWKEDKVLPTKVMAIGVADFAVQYVDTIHHVPISSWIFTPNRDSGFAQYAVSRDILPFYIRYIGPYPYKKLANVQSKTRFGGLEDASNIFYNEKSVSLHPRDPVEHRINVEALMAHETAHQWFGDEASETDWPHLWLSEGFATYLTDLYFEYRYGKDTLNARLARDRKIVLGFSKKRHTPVVDTSARNDPMKLLNPNTYQKGGWVLHMLRRKLGDSLFQKGLRSYYATYEGKNASTNDFRKVMEKVSGENLEHFFKQWLYAPGQPELKGSWHYDSRKKMLSITIEQLQHQLFEFPLEIGIQAGHGVTTKTISVHDKSTHINIPFQTKPVKLILDPNINLLFGGQIVEE